MSENKNLSNILVKSFELSEIHDNRMRSFECWGSVEILDRHNEIIKADEMYKFMDVWMDRGAPIMLQHTNINVGKGLNWTKADKDGKPGVLITGKIYNNYAEDDKVWSDLKNGVFEGLSVGGKVYKKEKTAEGTYLSKLVGYEFSLVDQCGNQEATFESINMLAKGKDNTPTSVNESNIIEKKMENTDVEKQEVNMVDIMDSIKALVERINSIEEKISGEPEMAETPVKEPVEEVAKVEAEVAEPEVEEEVVEKQVEESVEEPVEEVAKVEAPVEEVAKEEEISKKEFEEVKKELVDLKKSMAKSVIEGKRPVAIEALVETTVSKTEQYRSLIKSGASFEELEAAIKAL